jgi:coproporphyrinogen III oxidase-like Fe-S oxidoreductase
MIWGWVIGDWLEIGRFGDWGLAPDNAMAAPDDTITPSPNHSISNQSPIIDPKIASIYLHLPFCRAIRGYCNFNRGLLDDALKTRYVSALEAELKSIDDLGMGDW